MMEPPATYVRTHPDIRGFSIGDREHRISLFANNVILMLTDPEEALVAVHSSLSLFNLVSYYKVNDSK